MALDSIDKIVVIFDLFGELIKPFLLFSVSKWREFFNYFICSCLV